MDLESIVLYLNKKDLAAVEITPKSTMFLEKVLQILNSYVLLAQAKFCRVFDPSPRGP
jgi:hypothetical protein